MNQSSTARYDTIIVGGGIVGLATALQIQRSNPALRLLILEKESDLARHQTGNNSGVIHSGIYYKPGSLKATNCLNGYHQLIRFCKEQAVPYELCGKIIVATEDHERPLLATLYDRGIQNGLTGMKRLAGEELVEYEPHVSGLEGIFVPQTGIVDFTLVARAFGRILQEGGAQIHLSERVVRINDGEVITDKRSYQTQLTVNCAGLYSDKVASMTMGDLRVRIIPFRGEYYKLRKEKEYLVRNLIYPVPDPNFPFLGVHFTRMAKGGIEAGPNAVLAMRREGYKKSDINLREFGESLAWPGFQKVARKYWRTGIGEIYRSFSKAAFTRALQKLIPELRPDDLVPGGSGVRAQACDRDGGLVDDFMILQSEKAIHVCNAPSPAATSSLAIGETVAAMALKR
ncbi:MAG: L-2-hydroxyglutarate oxidase [Cytophagales bacterium]|nr:L-2-hydroxyglutarate oxidase [Cytophagales bacterium]